MLKVVEYLYVDLAIWAVQVKKFAEAVCQIVFLRKLEDRLAYLLAKPYYSLADEFRSPLAWTDEPWRFVSC